MVGLDPRLRAKRTKTITEYRINRIAINDRIRLRDMRNIWSSRTSRTEEEHLNYLISLFRGYHIPPPNPELLTVIDRISELTPDLMRYLKAYPDQIDELPWNVFEQLIAEFFARSGFRVTLVGYDWRTAADIFAAITLEPQSLTLRFFIEIKQWKDQVGVEVIDRVHGAMIRERPKFGWHAAIIVSRSGFKQLKRDTHRELELIGIELRDKDDLLCWLDEYEPHENGLWLPKAIANDLFERYDGT